MSYCKALFWLPVKKMYVKVDVLWNRGKIMSETEGHKSNLSLSASGPCRVCFTACWHRGEAAELLTYVQWTAFQGRLHRGANETDFWLYFTGVNNNNSAH